MIKKGKEGRDEKRRAKNGGVLVKTTTKSMD